ncbi:hypothetical protein LENED_007587 [Lentinula edodes]|uniref:Uncharacterized protein n=1 Tax=Lentinula edodes TaxID=5353 RepID=A0A1Q3EEW3_LENED|nr:hypothetical protein LENED_007587 [Lentinula edodes]
MKRPPCSATFSLFSPLQGSGVGVSTGLICDRTSFFVIDSDRVHIEDTLGASQSYHTSMKFLSTSLLFVVACVWATQAAYLSIHDQEQSWAGFQEGIMITPVLDELDSHFLCDVTIDNEVFQISVHSTSEDDWTSNTLDGRELPDEHITIIDQHLRLEANIVLDRHLLR